MSSINFEAQRQLGHPSTTLILSLVLVLALTHLPPIYSSFLDKKSLIKIQTLFILYFGHKVVAGSCASAFAPVVGLVLGLPCGWALARVKRKKNNNPLIQNMVIGPCSLRN